MNVPAVRKPENNIACSVIIRTKDRPNQLFKSLTSLRHQIRQPDDIIVVNDGGQSLAHVIAQFSDLPLTCLENETNQGRSAAGNLGVAKAGGDAVCFLDDDDIFFEDHIQRLALSMCRFDAKVAYSGCVLRQKDLLGEGQSPEQSVVQGEFNEPFDPDRLRFENYIPLITLIIEKSLFQEVGGFDDRFNLFEDWDLLLRLSQKTRFYHLDRITAEYTLWGKSQQITLASQTGQWRDAYTAVFKKHFLPLAPEDQIRFMADYWIVTQDRRSRIQALQKALEQQEEQRYHACARELEAALSHNQQLEEQLHTAENQFKEQIHALEQHIDTLQKQVQRIKTLQDLFQEQQKQTDITHAMKLENRESSQQKTGDSAHGPQQDVLAKHFRLLSQWIQSRASVCKTDGKNLVQTVQTLSDEIGQINQQIEEINQILNAFWIRQKICRPATIILADMIRKKQKIAQLLSSAEDAFCGFAPLLMDAPGNDSRIDKTVVACSPLFELFALKNMVFEKIHALSYSATSPVALMAETCLQFTIYCPSDCLSRIDIVLGTYDRINTCLITVRIFDGITSSPGEPPLRTVQFNAMEVINNHLFSVEFEPIVYSKNCPYRVEIVSENAGPQEHIAVWCHGEKTVENGILLPSSPEVLTINTHIQTNAWLSSLVKHMPLQQMPEPDKNMRHVFLIQVPFHDPETGLVAGTREQLIPMILVQLDQLVRKHAHGAAFILFGQKSEDLQQYCHKNNLVYILQEQDTAGSLSDKQSVFGILKKLQHTDHIVRAQYVWLLHATWLIDEDVISHAEALFSLNPDAAMIVPAVHNTHNTIFHGYGQMTRTGAICRIASLLLPADHPGNRYRRMIDAADTSGCVIRSRALEEVDLSCLDKYRTNQYQITAIIWQLKRCHGWSTWFDSRCNYVARAPREDFISHGSAISYETALEKDAKQFCMVWGTFLKDLPGPDQTFYALLNPRKNITALVIDDKLPTFDEDSGALRMFEILRILRQLDIRVSFFPWNRQAAPKYRHALEALGVEVFCGSYDIYDALICREYDCIIASRVEVAYQHMHLLKKTCPGARLYYDTVDIHYIRERRQADIEKSSALHRQAEETRKKELSNVIQADVVFTVTEDDKAHLLNEVPALDCFVLPNIHRVLPYEMPWEQREGLVFIGNYNHQPNVDAVFYFVENVFPLILAQLPDIKLYLVGSHMKDDMKALASGNIQTVGWVEKVEPELIRHRVMVSYLRYGAGMKGKIGQAMSLGLPVVSTAIGAEGMGLQDEKTAMVADDPETFAQKVCRLYTDPVLWKTVSENAREYVIEKYGAETIKNRLHSFLQKDLGLE